MDERTGMLVNLVDLKSVIQQVIQLLDHRNLVLFLKLMGRMKMFLILKTDLPPLKILLFLFGIKFSLIFLHYYIKFIWMKLSITR
jgi:6-pyruvoyl-tetrahydropterin synthase